MPSPGSLAPLRFIALAAGIASIWFGHHPVAADEGAEADTVYVVPPIIVEAPRIVRTEDALSRRSGFVAVVDVEKRRDRVEDLPAVLSGIAGVHVRQYGGLGSFATASIRGSSSTQVDVYLDGVPLNDAYIGLTNMADLPLDGLRRIEVFRGTTPPQLGAPAIGGAINLVTERSRMDGQRFVLHESYGSYRTVRHSASLWTGPPAAQLFVHAGYQRSDGDFEFADDHTTPFNPDDDQIVTRRNNDFEAWSVLGRLRIPLGRSSRVSLGHTTTAREQGVPGIGSRQSLTARAERSRHLTDARIDAPPLLDDHLRVFAGAFHSMVNEQCHDPDGDIGLIAQDTDNDLRSYGGDARAEWDVPVVPVLLELFHRETRERFTPRENLPTPTEGADRRRSTGQSVVSADLYVHRAGVVLTVAERWTRQETEFYDPPRFPWLPPTPQGRIETTNRSPHYGLRWGALHNLTLKANWSRAYRQPTMLELFGNAGSVTGRADLVPEEGVNRDVGLVLDFGKLWRARDIFAEAVYIDNKVENLIVFFPNSQYTTRPENIDSARIRGWEFSLSLRVAAGWRLAGNHTRLDTEDTGPIPYYNGNELPSRPKSETAVSVEYASRRAWNVSYELHYIGRNFLDPANQKLVPARTIHNAAVSVAAFDRLLQLTLEGRNLSDNRVSDISGFPLPGRSVFVTLAFRPYGG